MLNLLGNLQPGSKAEIIGFEQPAPEFEGFLRRLYEVGFLVGSQLEILQSTSWNTLSLVVEKKSHLLV